VNSANSAKTPLPPISTPYRSVLSRFLSRLKTIIGTGIISIFSNRSISLWHGKKTFLVSKRLVWLAVVLINAKNIRRQPSNISLTCLYRSTCIQRPTVCWTEYRMDCDADNGCCLFSNIQSNFVDSWYALWSTLRFDNPKPGTILMSKHWTSIYHRACFSKESG